MGKMTKGQFLEMLSERIAEHLTKKILNDTKKGLELQLEAFDTDDFLWSDAADAARADIEKDQGAGSWSPLGDQEDAKRFVSGLDKASEKDVDANASDWKQAYESFGEQLTAHLTQDPTLAQLSAGDPNDFLDSMAVAMYKYMMDRHANTPFLSSLQQWIIDLDDQFDPTDEEGQIQLNHIEVKIYGMLSTFEKQYNKSIIKKKLREEREQLLSLLKEVWGWSHSHEAYDNVRENLHGLPHEKLIEIMGEWDAYEAAGKSSSLMNADFDAVDKTKYVHLPNDVLADAIYEKSEELSNTDNGGSLFWVCPYGCHKVSADLEATQEMDEISEDIDDMDLDGGELSDDLSGSEYLSDEVGSGYYVVPPTANDPYWYVVNQDGEPATEGLSSEEEANAELATLEGSTPDGYGVTFKEGSQKGR